MTIDIGAEVARLEQMPVGELLDEYAERCGEMTSSRHRKYLIRKIAWRIQAQAEGGLTQRALQRAEALADDADIRVTPPKQTKSEFKPPATTKVVQPVRDPRIPLPGTMLIRKYKRRTIRVLVAADGFEFEGERYKTLSAVAKAITGSEFPVGLVPPGKPAAPVTPTRDLSSCEHGSAMMRPTISRYSPVDNA